MTIILFVSLLIAELRVPFMQFRLIKEPIYKEQQEALASGKKKFSIFNSMQKGYDRLIGLCFRWPKTTILIGVICVAASAWMFVATPLQLMPIAERNQFAVEIFLPQGTSVERTTQVADSLERIPAADDRVVSIASFPRLLVTSLPGYLTPAGRRPELRAVHSHHKSNQATIDVLDEYTGKYESWFPTLLSASSSSAILQPTIR